MEGEKKTSVRMGEEMGAEERVMSKGKREKEREREGTKGEGEGTEGEIREEQKGGTHQ